MGKKEKNNSKMNLKKKIHSSSLICYRPLRICRNNEWELSNPLLKVRASAPGESGITYSVLRPIAQVPGDPLLHLYTLTQGTFPNLIIPIPKSNTDILLTCLCKENSSEQTCIAYMLSPMHANRIS